ncbi:hypothetical protein RHSIM_Rhsim13G0038400 [Rhododendron simsii]|uniref:Protease Do-like PDZ domain-containing protein n=1 Tax=Rhododendron simsii TaxID=118357 RepID=A0A834L854_RHOSS|nr:hypothetical protein RHSIM_Rhsim13G0038400 [Rhododendron simsii]
MSSSLIIKSSSSDIILSFLCKSNKPKPSAAKFPNRMVLCSLSRSSPITLSKSSSVRDLVSSLGHTIVDWAKDCDSHGNDEEEEEEEEEASITVICVRVEPNFAFPWKMEQEEGCRSGFIVSGRKVLTSAGAVDLHQEVKLKKGNCDVWYTATVLSVAFDTDLAILTVNDDKFWKGVKPLEFGDMPAPGEKITVTGYPHGADYVSVIKGCVSGVGMKRYAISEADLPAFEVKVAWNLGKVGGPVFNGRGKCVGMILQHEDDKVGVVPAESIKHFIQDFDKNGAYTGLPILGIKWQKMESSSFRLFMKMGHDQQGVLITEVMPNYPEFEILKPYDIILSIDGISINNDGTVPFQEGQRIEFSYLIAQKYKGDKIVIRVLRDAKIHELTTQLPTHKQFVPANITGMPPQYYIIGGFVFTTLSIPYLQAVDGRYGGYEIPEEDKVFSQAFYEERVVLCQVLKADITIGYDGVDSVQNQVLVTFNDKPVKGLKSLVSMVDSCDEEFLKFTLENNNNTSAIIRYFSSRASVRDAISSLGERLLDWAEDLEADDDGEHEPENILQLYAVVEVLCIKPEPDFSSPWEREQQVSYGTGLIVSGRRVLTTARSVDHHTLVKLKKRNCDTRYNATVLAIAPECDLAMLAVHDDEFWKGVKPVEFGDMPSPGEKVIITGYRNDSYYLSLMTARVSRLGMTRNSFWGNKLLAFQNKKASLVRCLFDVEF